MPRFSSNDMVHNHYIDDARKKTQDRDRNSKTSVMPSARFQSTADGRKPKPKSTKHSNRSLLVSKSRCVMIEVVPIADHFKNSNSFSDFKHFVCSTCHKCVFNANHDACIRTFLNKVNSRATIQSNKTRNSNKPVEQKSHTQKPSRQIFKGHRNSSKNMPRFSSNDMIHNHYLDEARKKTPERDRNSKTSVMHSARFQSTADGSKPKPRSTNHSTRSLHVSKSICVTITAVHKAQSRSF
nr:hypothetical protein [Tanacetum cinerariifolium]